MRITDTLFINESEIIESFIRSSGPGGQNVNKVASAVQLRFNVLMSPSLTEEIRLRLMSLAGHRLTKEGVLIITAQRFRTQDLNRQDARARLFELICRALFQPKKRIPTTVSKAAKKRRLEKKAKVSETKQLRRPIKKILGDD